MATARKVGNRQLKVLCDCGMKHLITADDEGELEIESLLGKKKDDSKHDDIPLKKKETDIFNLLGD